MYLFLSFSTASPLSHLSSTCQTNVNRNALRGKWTYFKIPFRQYDRWMQTATLKTGCLYLQSNLDASRMYSLVYWRSSSSPYHLSSHLILLFSRYWFRATDTRDEKLCHSFQQLFYISRECVLTTSAHTLRYSLLLESGIMAPQDCSCTARQLSKIDICIPGTRIARIVLFFRRSINIV